MNKHVEYYITLFFTILLIPVIGIMIINVSSAIMDSASEDPSKSGQSDGENKDDQSGEDKDKKKKPEIVWGVDSATYTTEEFYTCVADEFGEPTVWGRYIGTKEDVSTGLDKEEVALLHDRESKILLIYNHFVDATGYDNGLTHAKEATKLAEQLEVPKGKAIFADIEPDYPVDRDFIKGWFEGMQESPYEPGIYGVFAEEQDLYEEFKAISEGHKDLKESVIIWTAYPQKEITSKENAPKFEPIAPKDSNILGWQYAIDANTCNIDTNLFKSEIIEYLW